MAWRSPLGSGEGMTGDSSEDQEEPGVTGEHIGGN